METKLLNINEKSLSLAADLLKKGELVAFPTETVYGLGADAFNPSAVDKIFLAKGRPNDNPLIVHVASKEQIGEVVKEITPAAQKIIDNLMPGAVTIILIKSDRVPFEVTAGLNTVAVRMPSHAGALRLIAESGVCIAAPSANLSGRPSPTTANHVFEDMQGRIPLILEGGETEIGLESTVLDLTGQIPRILRPGGVTLEVLRELLGEVEAGVESAEKPLSPGMKYTHYAPSCKVLLCEKTPDMVERIINKCQDLERSGSRAIVFAFDNNIKNYDGLSVVSLGADVKQASKRVFALFREQEKGTDYIIIEGFSTDGVGAALKNRLNKASGGAVL